MELIFVRNNNRFPGGKLPIIILIFGIIALYILHSLNIYYIDLCFFRRLTGLSCPTCGLSRSMLSLSRGHLIEAISYNPFMLVLTVVIFIYLATEILFKISISIKATKKQYRVISITLTLLFLVNWAFILMSSN